MVNYLHSDNKKLVVLWKCSTDMEFIQIKIAQYYKISRHAIDRK